MSESNSISIPTNPQFKNLTGRVFTRLTVNGYAGRSGEHFLWGCSCDCGNSVVVQGNNLVTGHSKSCGCLSRERAAERLLRHGGKKSAEYKTWEGMWNRCTNPRSQYYHLYADRRPPESWRDFAVFLSDVGPKPAPGLSLDRIDNDKPYGPGNCRWTTSKVQNNNRSDNVHVEHGGVTLTAAQWSERVGVNATTLRRRLRDGWSAERALTTPTK